MSTVKVYISCSAHFIYPMLSFFMIDIHVSIYFSKELVTHVLGLQKPRKDSNPSSGRCIPLEQQLVELLFDVMTIAESGDYAEENLTDLFRNIASDLIYFVLFQVESDSKLSKPYKLLF